MGGGGMNKKAGVSPLERAELRQTCVSNWETYRSLRNTRFPSVRQGKNLGNTENSFPLHCSNGKQRPCEKWLANQAK